MNYQETAYALMRYFESGNMILLLGEDHLKEPEEQIYSMRWNCVLTTSRDPELVDKFLTDPTREVIDNDLKEVAGQPDEYFLSRSSLKIIRLCGVDEPGRSEEETNDLLAMRRRREMLNRISRILCVNMGHLVILGWPKEADPKGLTQTLLDVGLEMPARSILAFGVEQDDTLYPVISALEESSKIPFMCKERLSDILMECALYDEEDDEDGYYESASRDQYTRTIFARGGEIHVSTLDFVKCSSYATLLTEEDVVTPVIYGKSERRDHLYFFMRDSVSRPVWEGYNPKNNFYVKRDVEDPLYELTSRVLRLADKNEDGVWPILLMGHPGSSKSITLAAVAYRIFCEQEYPVVYMTNNSLRLRNIGGNSNFYHFNKMLKDLELAGSEGAHPLSVRPVLIVWDGSISDAKSRIGEFWDALKGHNRRAVLLCSAYSQKGQLEFSSRETDGLQYEVSNSSRDDVRFYMMESTRELNERERVKLEQLCKEVAQVDHNAWKDEKDGGNLFLRLYDDLEWMRGSLAGIVKMEHNSFLSGEMMPASLSLKTQKTAMAIAFERAGLTSDGSAEERIINMNWESLSICVALFTRFHVELPISAGLTVLCDAKGLDNEILERIISLPWLRYGPAGDDPDSYNYVLQYRTAREAEILLSTVSVEEQRDCILTIISRAAEYYRETRSVDATSLKAVHQLLGKIGPNSKEEGFRGTQLQDNWRRECYADLLDSLAALREAGVYQLYLIADEVTFTRELYQGRIKSKDPEECIEVIECLMDAQRLAQETIAKQELEHDQSKVDRFIVSNLNVEIVHCSGAAWSCYQNYIDLVGEKEAQLKLEPEFIRFEDLWDSLRVAVQNDRENSFNYIAVLRLFNDDFERRYRENASEETLRQLRDNVVLVRDLLTELETDEFISPTRSFNKEQKAEYDAKKTTFEGCVDKLNSGENISIDRVLQALETNDLTGFFGYFKDRTETERNPSAVLYVAQAELSRARVRYNEVMTDAQVETCRRVYDFMESYNTPKYNYMVQAVPSGAFLRLRLYWAILTNGEPMIPKKTYTPAPPLSQEEWRKLIQHCDDYFALMTGEFARRNDPKISYLKALALAEVGEYRLAASEVEQVNRSLFHTTTKGNPRRKAYYLISNPVERGGTAVRIFHNGRVTEINEDGTGYIRMRDFPNLASDHDGVHFHFGNLGMTQKPPKGKVFEELELALSFAGFTLHLDKKREDEKR